MLAVGVLLAASACGGASSAEQLAARKAATPVVAGEPQREDPGPAEPTCPGRNSVELVPAVESASDQPVLATNDDADKRSVLARWYDARIFFEPDTASMVIGYARRGQRLRISQGATGKGCPADMWYALEAGGYACAAREFREGTVEISDPVPIEDAPLPFGYAKLIRDQAWRFDRLPSADELAALDEGRTPPDLVADRMKGAYFTTVVETSTHLGEAWHRCADGKWVRGTDVERLAPPQLRGEPLEGPDDLPLAFVFVPQTEVRCPCGDEWVVCGDARRMARFAFTRRFDLDGETYVQSDAGHAVAASDVRVAELAPRPDKIGEDEQWIRVDLSEQSLVAYEGDRPVLATLVSTGKADHATPTGIWRVGRKYVSTTMSGPDEDKGTYTVGEVPWTMFYEGDFALHGAYWHEEFGAVRSHGCTNIPPADARWLFGWGGGVPSGWHAASHREGPWVVIAD